jgi:hypothetical protein
MNYTLKIKPLSINQAFKGVRYKTVKCDKFIRDVLLLLPNKIDYPDKNNVRLAIQFGFSSKACDCSNHIKIFEDCLVKKYGVDDRYTSELHVFKTIVKKGEEYIKFRIY